MIKIRKNIKTQKTILVVEDEKSLRNAMSDILRLKKYKSLEAKNGKEGVKIALLKHPDLILLDLIMPEMDGITALKKIREDSWGENVPVIILTNLGVTSKQFLDDVVVNRPINYLTKSNWKIHDVIEKIEKIFENKDTV
jgi:CheY-like chemotaxis protein